MILLDTHALLWFLNNDSQLSSLAKHTIETSNDVLISVASTWEITIKHSIDKLTGIVSIETLKADLETNQFNVLPIRWRELSVLDTLSWHHKDPFDRLMIAQSLAYNLPVIGKDETWDQYGIKRIW